MFPDMLPAVPVGVAVGVGLIVGVNCWSTPEGVVASVTEGVAVGVTMVADAVTNDVPNVSVPAGTDVPLSKVTFPAGCG